MSLRIKSVDSDGLGAYLGLAPGDRLLKINGRRVPDHLDYQFRIIDAQPVLELEKAGIREVIEIEKDDEVDLGVQFEDFKIRGCANDCVFCFVDQNPKGLREGLYFRDGDYRMSFLYGHYITLTNMGQKELDRIVEQRLSPLYISVHATEAELRKKLLLYLKNDDVLGKMKYLVYHGIELHSQIVLCPTLNDGDHLEHSMRDLHPLSPGLRTVSIVPVGLTGHRQGLTEIPPVTNEYAESFMSVYDQLDSNYRHSDGGRMVILSDEWYLLAGLPVPEMEFYQGLSIEENGVGLVRGFLDRFAAESAGLPNHLSSPKRITLATGLLAAPVFEQYILPRLNKIGNLEVVVQTVPNRLLGSSVTVAGLLSGGDFIDHLAGADIGDEVWTTDRILNDAGNLTLDDMSIEDMGNKIGVPFRVSGDSILDLVTAVDNG